MLFELTQEELNVVRHALREAEAKALITSVSAATKNLGLQEYWSLEAKKYREALARFNTRVD